MEPQKKSLKLNEKDFLMYFHTAIRNLGLYLSASLAILGVSALIEEKIEYTMLHLLSCLLLYY